MIQHSPTPPLLITARERHLSASDSSKSSEIRRRIVEVMSPYPIEDFESMEKKKRKKKEKKHKKDKKIKRKKKKKHKSKSSSDESESDSGLQIIIIFENYYSNFCNLLFVIQFYDMGFLKIQLRMFIRIIRF